MKINNFSFKNNFTFGYNKQFHQKVHNHLSVNKTPVSVAMKMDDGNNLAMEDILVKMEESGQDSTSEYKDLAAFMVDKKQNLAFYIHLNYEELDYPNQLIKTYLDELRVIKEKCGNNFAKYASYSLGWRGKLISALADYSSEDYSKAFEELKIALAKKKSDVDKTVEEIRAQALDEAAQNELNDILTLYEPNLSSPVGFDDVVGLDDIKEMFQDDLIQYINNPEQLEIDKEEYGIRMPRGFLFYGPPGCGKTFIVQALAQESGLKMYKMDVSKVGSSYTNKTSINIEKAFDTLSKVAKKDAKPVILFMDEIDSLAFERGSLKSESGENSKTTSTLLKKIETARDNGIIVIAATNKFDMIDGALKQRFDVQRFLSLPNVEQIKSLLNSYLSKIKKGQALSQNIEAIERLSLQLKGYSNRQIVQILDRAIKLARKDNRSEIKELHILDSIAHCDLLKVDEKQYRRAEDNKKESIGFKKLD